MKMSEYALSLLDRKEVRDYMLKRANSVLLHAKPSSDVSRVAQDLILALGKIERIKDEA
jgi:hypothetical protein